MSAENIETTHSMVKTKIASLRPNADTIATAAGVGVGLFTVLSVWNEKNSTSTDKILALASVIPVVGTVFGLEEGIESGNAEGTAVNALALAGIVVAQAVPVVGELIDVGLSAYTLVTMVRTWWQSLDSETQQMVGACANELFQRTTNHFDALISGIQTAKIGHPPCIDHYMAYEKNRQIALAARAKYQENHPVLFPTPPQDGPVETEKPPPATALDVLLQGLHTPTRGGGIGHW